MTDDPPPTNPDTRRLLARAAAGDDRALDQLARAVWPDIRRWALLELGDAASADDASQETLVRLLRNVRSLDVERPIEGWLRTVVRNCCRDLRRREGRAGRVTAPEPQVGCDLDRAVDLRRGAQAAIDAYVALTPRQREVWDLVDRQGTPSAEVAATLGIADGTVRALLHQARRALRGSLTEQPEIRSLLRSG